MSRFGRSLVTSAAAQAIAGKPSLLNALLAAAAPATRTLIHEFRDARSAAEKGEVLQ